jgi:hypothetical protein
MDSDVGDADSHRKLMVSANTNIETTVFDHYTTKTYGEL